MKPIPSEWLQTGAIIPVTPDTVRELLEAVRVAYRCGQEAEREACALEAESLWQQLQDTKDAHERLSPDPFMPGRFGFDQSTVQLSRRIADAIRARGQQ